VPVHPLHEPVTSTATNIHKRGEYSLRRHFKHRALVLVQATKLGRPVKVPITAEHQWGGRTTARACDITVSELRLQFYERDQHPVRCHSEYRAAAKRAAAPGVPVEVTISALYKLAVWIAAFIGCAVAGEFHQCSQRSSRRHLEHRAIIGCAATCGRAIKVTITALD